MKAFELLERLELPMGKKSRLARLFSAGSVKGALKILPYDHGIEHGPIDFFDNPESLRPEYVFNLAEEEGFNAIAVHLGLAKRYYKPQYAKNIPLVLKLNGKTNIPSDNHAFSPLTGTVQEAVALDAVAVGYTLYVGSPRQDDDFRQLLTVREASDKYGMPLIIWSYPRGEAADKKGGRDSLYMVDYAARLAHELGADITKLNMPKKAEESVLNYPKEYKKLEEGGNVTEWVRKVVQSAGSTFVIFSGGSKKTDEEILNEVKICKEAGAIGFIFGRNIWQRKREEAAKIIEEIDKVLAA